MKVTFQQRVWHLLKYATLAPIYMSLSYTVNIIRIMFFDIPELTKEGAKDESKAV